MLSYSHKGKPHANPNRKGNGQAWAYIAAQSTSGNSEGVQSLHYIRRTREAVTDIMEFFDDEILFRDVTELTPFELLLSKMSSEVNGRMERAVTPSSQDQQIEIPDKVTRSRYEIAQLKWEIASAIQIWATSSVKIVNTIKDLIYVLENE
jgi:hypothetical protein